MSERVRKRLVFCFDGTSNTLDREFQTNVAITAAAVRNTSKTGPQIVYYDEGVGSTKDDAFEGGAFGSGLYDKVVEAYKFLVFNYEPGDDIFIFGFSRGAYTARSFAGLIHHVGVVNSCFAEQIKVATALYQKRDADNPSNGLGVLTAFRQRFVPDCCANKDDFAWRKDNVPGFDPDRTPVVRIRYIGVWDTVKTIGSSVFGDRDDDGDFDAAEFHDHNLHSSVDSARHAVALDERRKKFNVTIWDNVDALNAARGLAVDDPNRPYQQLWFPGDHGSVGGGGDVRGLSDEGLEWVLEGAKAAGLALDTSTVSRIYGIKPNVLAPLENSSKTDWSVAGIGMKLLPKGDRVGPKAMHEVSLPSILRWAAPKDVLPEGESYRPGSLDDIAPLMNGAAGGYEDWEFRARGGYADRDESLPDIEVNGKMFCRHAVRSGETLGIIARDFLGDATRKSEILALNRTTIMDADRLYVGQVLNLPKP